MTRARQNAELSQGIDVSSGVLNQTLFVPSDNFVNVSGTITANTGVFDLVGFNNATEIVPTEGQLTWDTTYGTLDIGFTDTYALHVGQETNFRVRNETGGTLYKGQVVAATGVHSDNIRLEIDKYTADGNVREVRFIGLISEDIGDNGSGYTTSFGYIRGNATYALDTRGNVESPIAVGDETWVQGDILYVHPTVAGKLTRVEPKHSISVAIVIRVHQTDGVILVRPTSYGHLNDNHDVDTSGVVDNNFLVWNSGLDTWEPSSGLHYVDGDIGIGTASPVSKLDVSGIITASGGDSSEWNESYHWVSTSGGLPFASGTGNAGHVAFWTDTNELFYDNGNFYWDFANNRLGLGTSLPSYKLDVVGTANITGDTIVGGDLTVNGTTVIANVDTMEVKDPIITLGLSSGNIVTDTNLDRGVAFVLNSSTTAFMGWDTDQGEFALLSSGVATNSSGNYAPGAYGALHVGSLESNGNILAANIGSDTDNSVVILNSAGLLKTDEIDPRVWGSSLVDGSGTTNYLSKWSDSNTSTNSIIYDDGTSIGIGTSSPSYKLDVNGVIASIGLSGKGAILGDLKVGYDTLYRTVQTHTDGQPLFLQYSNTGGIVMNLNGGNVGIGLTNPTEKLDVSGNVNISGHLSASTKSFLIDHPNRDGKKLQYGSLESPYHGVRLTGKDKVVKGVCVVKLPDYISSLVHEENINIQITNYKHHKSLYVDSIDLEKNIFTVKGYRCKSAGELEFFWSFTAIRKDVPELIVEK